MSVLTLEFGGYTDEQILHMLHVEGKTYREVCNITGYSNYRVWKIAKQHEALKNQRVRDERSRARKDAERYAFLEQAIDDIISADVRAFYQQLPDNCIDLVVTSIPYNVGKPYGGNSEIDSLRFQTYRGRMIETISELGRTLKDHGTAVINVGNSRNDQRQFRPLDIVFFNEFLEAGLTPISRIAWTRGHGLFPKNRLAERWEVALVMFKGDHQAVFNPGAGRTPQKYPDKKAFRGPNKGELSGNYLGAWPCDVWEMTPVKANHPEYDGQHPCPFPIEFARRAIGLWSRPGDLVCDPFEGSGSTRIASIQTHRKFIGCDLFYGELRAERAASAQMDTLSPLPGVTEHAMELRRPRTNEITNAA